MGNGWVRPSEFWALQPAEIWWIIEANVPQDKRADLEAIPDLFEMLSAEEEAELDE